MASLLPLLLSLVFGSLVLVPPLYALFSYLYIVFVHGSTINQYRLSSASYALVTGASDGIGKSFAKQFLKLGFNVVIHGRNLEKLNVVKEELVALGTGKDVRVLIADANQLLDVAEVDRQLDGLEITVLVNNIGGTTPPSVSFDQQSLKYVDQVFAINANFPLRLTHHLLPRLRALPGPTLICALGSIASEVAAPWLTAYCSSKAFLDTFIRSIYVQERTLLKSNVHVHYFQTGTVLTNAVPRIKAARWDCPTPDAYARACLRVVGCGRRKICPWWGHAVMASLLGMLGESQADALAASLAAKAHPEDKKED